MPTLITPAYLEEQRALHAAPRGYGGKGSRWADMVATLCRDTDPSSILDYGAGQATLERALWEHGWFIKSYDPAVEGIHHPPGPADLVICTDVLEHIEPECLDAVIEDLARLTLRTLFVVIGLTPTAKTLSDGRQAHISLHPPTWWGDRLRQAGFKITEIHSIRPDKQWVAVLQRTQP